jgi:hypothetical protein
MATYIKHKKANPLVQIGAMKLKYPQFKSKKVGDNIIFIGDLFVKPELPIYTVSIEYRGNLRPTVKIISPELVEKPPHTFSDKSLCLYHSSNFKWSAEKLIAKEIVDWTITWIYFYEYWLQEGEWIAPEVPHNTDTKDEQKDTL